MVKSDKVSSTDPDDVQKVVRDKLAKALTLLTGGVQVARWESGALTGNNSPGIQQIEGLGLKKISHKRNRGR